MKAFPHSPDRARSAGCTVIPHRQVVWIPTARLVFLAFVVLVSSWVVDIAQAAGTGHRGDPRAAPALAIQRELATGRVIVSWQGRGRLVACQAPGETPVRLRMRGRHGQCAITPVAQQMTFELESAEGSVVSVNAVGYYILTLPPGFSLVAYQLYHTNHTLGFQWPNAPDGAQFFKYTDGLGYEVSTFDGASGGWSNPNLVLRPGEAFYFRNPTAAPVEQVFVGEVPQGRLIVPLPAGLSAKASIVPQAGGLNSRLQVPGEDGDEVHLYVNDGFGNGSIETSVFHGELNAWVPEPHVAVGEGFWIRKQRDQEWIREFYVN